MVLSRPTKNTQLFERLAQAHQRARSEIKRSVRRVRYYAFSDSLFLVYKVSRDESPVPALRVCYEDVRRVLMVFLQHDLPLRGGIAKGSVQVGNNLVLGDAVIRAVNYERLIEAPLVVLPAAELPDPKLTGMVPFWLGVQQIQVRSGGVMKGVVLLPEDDASFEDFVNRHFDETATTGPFEVASAWLRAKGQFLASRTKMENKT